MKENRVAVITGAANGIGRAAALKFAGNDFFVALVDYDLPGLNSLKNELEDKGLDSLVVYGDLKDFGFIRNIIDTTREKWGRIDVVINNAAWRTIETMRSISLENWEKTLRVCLTAPAFLARYAAADMEERNAPGIIINISSVMSQRAGGISPAYMVCKGGIESLTYELAVLYGPKMIRVVAVNPGNIDTNLSNDYTDEKGNNVSGILVNQIENNTPLMRRGTADEIANVCYWLTTNDASFISGTSILVDGGLFHNFDNYQMKKLQFPKEF